MRDSGKSYSKRIAAGIIGIMMLVVVLFSVSYIAAEADHDCAGDDCPICVCIQQCENILSQVVDGAVRVLVAAPVVVFLLIALFSANSITQETLVSQKVRLNN